MDPVGRHGFAGAQPGARHSQDIDFSRPVDLDTAVTDLAELIHATPAPDPFGFDIEPDPANSDDHHLRLKITVRLGASVIDTFPVDITYRPAITAVDTVQPNPVIVIEDVDDLPPLVTVPLAQQVADKLCAMYERHGAEELPSSRYRDLVDLMIIVTGTDELDAAVLAVAVDAEQRRRDMTIPAALPSPSRQWSTGYNRLATRLLVNGLPLSISDRVGANAT